MTKQPPEHRIQTTCLMILAGVAIGVALYWLRGVLLPFVLAVFLAIVFLPVRDFFRRTGCRTSVSLAATIFTGFIVLALMALVISVSAAQAASKSPQYEEHLAVAVEKVSGQLAKLGYEVDFEVARDHLRGAVFSTIDTVVGLVSNGFLILIFFCFLLAGGGDQGGVGHEIALRVRSYVLTKVAVSALTGVLVGVTLWLLGVDLALVFGLLAFMFNFIPNVGSFIAVLLPLPIVLLDPAHTTTTAVLAIGIPVAINFVIGNVIEPKLMGEAVGIHPIAILLALVFWGTLWGIAGMFLAVPLTVSLKLLLERLEMTAPLARAIAGRGRSQDSAPTP